MIHFLQAKEHNTSSISRPSTGLSRSVRASVDVNKTKQGESPVAPPRVAISRRIRPTVSKPGPPSKSALRSSKNELTSSCSSLESCISASSSACKKSPLESANQKKSQSSRTAFHSMANGSTSRVSPLSATSTFKSRLSSNNASFLSASVDWSFNSPRAPTPNKMAKGKKKTVSAVQHDPMPDQHGSMTKPTGLRVPSPKLGYFDGVRFPKFAKHIFCIRTRLLNLFCLLMLLTGEEQRCKNTHRILYWWLSKTWSS